MYNQPNYYNNQFMNPNMRYQQPMQMMQPVPQVQTIDQQQIYGKQNNPSLQGKSVDSVEVVKAMDIPLDGSISYFPLADGTAIVTKQLQIDGTSKTIVYKPVDEKETIKNEPKYITDKELEESLKKINSSEIKDELKSLKKQLKLLSEDVDELRERKD